MKGFWTALAMSLCGLTAGLPVYADTVKGEMALIDGVMQFNDPDNWYSFRTPVTGETTQNEDGSRNFMWDAPEGKFFINVARNVAATPVDVTPEVLDAEAERMIVEGSAEDLGVAKDVTSITGRSILTLPGVHARKMAVWHVVAGENRLFYGMVLTPKGSLMVICLGDTPECLNVIGRDFRVEAGAY